LHAFKKVEAILNIFFKLVSLSLVAVFILSITFLVLTLRRPKKVSMTSISITIAMSFVSLTVFSILTQYSISFRLWLLLAAAGGVIGWFWARTTRVFAEDGRVMARNSVWYLAVWACVFAVNQVILILSNRPAGTAMGLLIVSTAMVWGTNGCIMRGYFRVKTESPRPESRGCCPKCSVPFMKGAGFCMKCGAKL